MKIDIAVETPIPDSSRIMQLSAMFDCPVGEKSRVEWHGELPIDNMDWSVGLIVGPSGAGKTTVARQLFGNKFDVPIEWGAGSVIDDFSESHSIPEITEVCQAVGFNTIPSWMRPYRVLSNGERFRVDLARRLLELEDPIVVDEFTSVVDRQVAQIGAYAVQKYVRRNKRKFVGISCHSDIIPWLEPDWLFEPATMHFARRSLQRRPPLDITICRVPYSAWPMFAPFHYLRADLNRAARCFGLFVENQIASFVGLLPKPVATGAMKGTAITGVSRIVTLPDWQGLGLAFVLCDHLGAAYKAIGKRLRNYPAHPGYVINHRKSSKWQEIKRAGKYSALSTGQTESSEGWGGRPCGVFEYVGPAMEDREAAENLLAVA
jgi:GNAT superfamily N-acetyltransferase